MQTEITQEVLNQRVRESRAKTDNISLTLPKGTKEIIIELTGERPATFCNKIVIEYIKRLKAEQEGKESNKVKI